MKQTKSNKLLRIRSVMDLTGLSRSYIYQLCAQGRFPKQVQLVEGGTSVAWIEREIQEWIQKKISERNIEV